MQYLNIVRFAIATILGIFLIAGSYSEGRAQSVRIEGKVVLAEQGSQSTISLGGYQSTGGGGQTSRSDKTLNDLIIWLEKKDFQASSDIDQQEIKVLDQVNKEFQPKLMPVRAGHQVRIKNSDPMYHNVFSLSSTKRFDVGRRSPEEYADVLFDQPGIVDVFCDIHSDMHAVIVVLPGETLRWKKMNGEGGFQFKELPKGHYTLKLYALGDRQETVHINAKAKENISLGTIRVGS